MIVKKNENLEKYTTMRIGGIARKLFVPETKKELIQLLNSLQGEEYYLLAAGSNILMNDKKTFANVIYLMDCNKDIVNKGEGRFYVGCSVRLQKLIITINSQGFGGIEFLYSVPGSVGGAVIMNAGRGKEYNCSISEYIESVEVLVDGKIKNIDKVDCLFSYRDSKFKRESSIILGVNFCFARGEENDFVAKRQERMEHVKLKQDYSGYNFGSVFKKCNKYAMALIKIIKLGKKGNVCFSEKTSNWLLNKGNGDYAQAVNLIKKAKIINKLFGTSAELEVVLWE